MRLTVLLFASLREISGEERLEIDLPAGSRLGDLEARLLSAHPSFSKIAYVFAVNQEYAGSDRVLQDGDEVALVPAISGGSGRVSFGFTREPIDPRLLEEKVRGDEDGAVLTFSGVTRNHHDGKRVVSLSYEAYEEMAQGKLLAILDQCLADFDLSGVAMLHRLGEVPIGEASLVLSLSAPHREATFSAVERIMDRLKREVPIFKKESYEGSGPQWVGEVPEV